jgi:hypothetical protein
MAKSARARCDSQHHVTETEIAPCVHVDLAAIRERVRKLQADTSSTDMATRLRARTELPSAEHQLDMLTLKTDHC